MAVFIRHWAERLALPALLGVLWLWLVNQLRLEWTVNPQYSYGWLVPVLAGYLLWRRWLDRPPPAAARTSAGLLLWIPTLLLLPLRLIEEANPDWRLVSWMLALAILAITLILIYQVGGSSWVAHFAFPGFFMLVSVPWPSEQETWLVQHLMRYVAGITVEMLNWAGVLAVQRGNLICMPEGVIGVSEACSGVRSLQSTLMAALFVGELYRLRWPRRIGLLLAGVICSFALNLLRALLLTGLCAWRGEKILGTWHDPAGFIILLASFAFLLFAAWRLREPEKVQAPTQKKTGSAPRMLPLVSALLLLWLAAVEGLTEGWYWLHERDAGPRLVWDLKWPPTNGEFQEKPVSSEVRAILRYDEGREILLRFPDGAAWNIFDFHWSPGKVAAALARSHSPEICLPAAGGRLLQLAMDQEMDAAGLRLPLQTYTFDWGGRTLYVFYIIWEQRRVSQDSGPPLEFYRRSNRLEAVWEGRRHLGQQVLEIVVSGYSGPEEARRHVRDFLQDNIVIRQ